MGISTMTLSGETHIPNGWTGKIDSKPSLESKRPLENRAITEALQKIYRDIESLGNQISLLKNQLENQKIVKNKVINIYNAQIDTRSIDGLYYKYFKNALSEEGIEESEVLSVTIADFIGSSEMFGVGFCEFGILLTSNSPQTIDKVTLNVTYLNAYGGGVL